MKSPSGQLHNGFLQYPLVTITVAAGVTGGGVGGGGEAPVSQRRILSNSAMVVR